MFFYQQNKHFYSKAPQNAGSSAARDKKGRQLKAYQDDEEGLYGNSARGRMDKNQSPRMMFFLLFIGYLILNLTS